MKEEEKNHETTGKKTTLTDKIYQDIKDDILTKVFQPGEKLNIKELAREYQVSDTPVKQALQRLAEEKLVVNTPNKGMSVRALTPHELQDIFDMRLMMDTFFVKDIVTTLNYNHGLRQQLIDCLEAQKKFIESNDSNHKPDEFFELDLEFHTLYLAASGNQKGRQCIPGYAALHLCVRHLCKPASLQRLRMCRGASGNSGCGACVRFRRAEGSRYRASE